MGDLQPPDPDDRLSDAPPPAAAYDLEDQVWRTRLFGGRLKLGERALAIAAGVCIPVGLLVIYLGWYGASHTANLYEQNPFFISGGQLGVALVTLGGFCYFGHWLTEILKQQRAQSTALLDAVRELQRASQRDTTRGDQHSAEPADSRVVASRHQNGRALVATPRGTMAHRLDCPVVADKAELRPVDVAEALRACKYCDPYGADMAT